MNEQSLYSISPIDGRYTGQTECLQQYFSEAALIKYRVKVEVLYFIFLIKRIHPNAIDDKLENNLHNIYKSITHEDILEIKSIERVTNHDVKAVEYFVKGRIDSLGLSDLKEFVHFCLTSQDINNTSIPLMIKDASLEVLYPKLEKLLDKLDSLADDLYDVPMLARTHGQAATPTRVGREIKVFSYRIKEQFDRLRSINITAKFGGATGGLNAHLVTYPEIDWVRFADDFVLSMGLKRESYTTQISNYDNIGAYFDCVRRISVILIDFCRDMWQYISMEYFKQRIKENEVGSSAMPHKVNPIDFENAEGNLSIAVALCNFLSDKLPISRLQRDLTDSTVLRNIGVPISHFVIAYNSLDKGLGKIIINKQKIEEDLQNNVVVIAEAIQCVLRREGYDSPYEKLKELTRNNNHISIDDIHKFINSLDISSHVKDNLLNITPYNYIGM